MIDAGVMVVRPSASLFLALARELAHAPQPYVTLPEQELLSAHYLDGSGHGNAVSDRFRFLPSGFGQCSSENKRLVGAKIFRSCRANSYLRLPLCVWDRSRGSADCPRRLLEAVEGPEQEASAARQEALRLYQQMVVEANPCAVHSLSADSCAGAEAGGVQCHWCDNATRCLPLGACDIGTTEGGQGWQEQQRTSDGSQLLRAQKHRRLFVQTNFTTQPWPPLNPNTVAPCDNGAVALDFGKFCALDPHSDTGSVRPRSTRVVGSLADAEGVRLSRLGSYDGEVFDVVLKFVPATETSSDSESCDGAECVSLRMCRDSSQTLELRVQVGSRATLEFTIVLPDTDTPLAIPGTYMSIFDLDGTAGDSPDGMAQAVAFRGASVQVEEYYCTSCGPSVPGIRPHLHAYRGPWFVPRAMILRVRHVGSRSSPPACSLSLCPLSFLSPCPLLLLHSAAMIAEP